MALFNYATKEITLKIVYYGPGLSGKTTNLQYLHTSVLSPRNTGKLLSLSTETDRTLFFDFLPVELGKIRDFTIRFQLYTVPGQVRYNSTRRIVLKGADAVIFVADSQRDMQEQNLESFENMRENLIANNVNPDEVPIVMQYNKRDLKNISSVDELDAYLNQSRYPVIETVATTGAGVEDSFKLVTKLMLKFISQKHKIEIQPPAERDESATETAAQPEPVSQPPLFAPPTEQPLALQAEGTISIPELDTAFPPSVQTTVSTPASVSDSTQEGLSDESAGDAMLAEEAPAPEVIEEPLPVTDEMPPPARTEGPYESMAMRETPEDTPAAAEDVSTLPSVPPDEAIPSAAVEILLEMRDEISRLSASVAALQSRQIGAQEIAGISDVLTDIKNSVYVLSKESRETREIIRRLDETNEHLRGLVSLFEGLKTGKSWFKF